jgi:hypothetical protein
MPALTAPLMPLRTSISASCRAGRPGHPRPSRTPLHAWADSRAAAWALRPQASIGLPAPAHAAAARLAGRHRASPRAACMTAGCRVRLGRSAGRMEEPEARARSSAGTAISARCPACSPHKGRVWRPTVPAARKAAVRCRQERGPSPMASLASTFSRPPRQPDRCLRVRRNDRSEAGSGRVGASAGAGLRGGAATGRAARDGRRHAAMDAGLAGHGCSTRLRRRRQPADARGAAVPHAGPRPHARPSLGLDPSLPIVAVALLAPAGSHAVPISLLSCAELRLGVALAQLLLGDPVWEGISGRQRLRWATRSSGRGGVVPGIARRCVRRTGGGDGATQQAHAGRRACRHDPARQGAGAGAAPPWPSRCRRRSKPALAAADSPGLCLAAVGVSASGEDMPGGLVLPAARPGPCAAPGWRRRPPIRPRHARDQRAAPGPRIRRSAGRARPFRMCRAASWTRRAMPRGGPLDRAAEEPPGNARHGTRR